MSADERVLPSLLVIGAQKAGTTSLHSWLAQHPAMEGYARKEAHYFDGGTDHAVDAYARGPGWYASLFPARAELAPGAITFESTPLYLFNPLAAGRIRQLLPRVRMVAVLRDPVERAISHYYHVVQRGREDLPLAEALRAEEARLALAAGDYKHPAFIRHSYKSRGLYAQQLERYFALFDREQLLVLSSDELFSDPEGTVRRVLRHAGVEEAGAAISFAAQNVGRLERGADEAEADWLAGFFREPNERLFALLGRRFDWR